MILEDKFPYILENLLLTSPGILEIILGSIGAIILVIGFRWIFLYSYGWSIVHHDGLELQKKKETLTDLILMKDIQTELEKEIGQAMLKATFQG